MIQRILYPKNVLAGHSTGHEILAWINYFSRTDIKVDKIKHKIACKLAKHYNKHNILPDRVYLVYTCGEPQIIWKDKDRKKR